MILNDNECLCWKENGKKYALTVWNDDFPSDPREDREAQINHMACWNRGWNLGDEHDYKDPMDFAVALADRFGVKYDVYEDMPDTIMARIADKGYIVFMPIWAYEHGNIALSCGDREYPFNDRWDSYQTGYIYLTKEEALKLGYKEDKWKEAAMHDMKLDIEEYNYYVQGEVSGYSLYVMGKGKSEYREEENCAGFLGFDIEKNGIKECVGVPESAEVCSVKSVLGKDRPA